MEMTTLNTVILGITTSFVASLIFTYIFTQLKPKLKISTVIGHTNGIFKIKIINRSRFAATNIKAELSYINFFAVPGGQETNSTKIHLVKKELFALDKFEKDSEFATHTYRFVTKHGQDLRQGLNQNNRQFIRLKISANHSVSNIGKVFEQRYRAAQIIDGDYGFGDIIEIVPDN
jgi:hypothetical protein